MKTINNAEWEVRTQVSIDVKDNVRGNDRYHAMYSMWSMWGKVWTGTVRPPIHSHVIQESFR